MRKSSIGYWVSAVALGMAASTAQAASPSGYVGLAVGWNDTQMEASASTQLAGPLGGDIREQTELGLTGPSFGVVLGGKMPINTGYVGLEANVFDSSSESENKATIDGATGFASALTSDLSYGLNVQLGTDISPSTRIYGLVGVQLTDFGVKQQGVSRFDEDETLTGARFGLGLESDITDMLAVRLQWTQTQYEDFKVSRSDPDPVNGFTESVKFEPTENLFSVAFTGKF